MAGSAHLSPDLGLLAISFGCGAWGLCVRTVATPVGKGVCGWVVDDLCERRYWGAMEGR